MDIAVADYGINNRDETSILFGLPSTHGWDPSAPTSNGCRR